MDAEDPKLILKRLRAEYRKVWDKEYDREEAKRNEVPKRKTRARHKKRWVQNAKAAKGTKGKRKTVLILP